MLVSALLLSRQQVVKYISQEWYNPQAITTKDGNLVITITEQENHDLNFQSGEYILDL